MSLYIKNIGSRKFRVMLRNGDIEDIDCSGTGADGRYTFWIDPRQTPLECFDQTVGHGKRLVLKGHTNDDDRNEVLYHRCPVCGKKPGKYKPGTYEDRGI